MKAQMTRMRVRGLIAALVAPLALGGCDALLDVDNPQVVTDSDLTDQQLVASLENGIRAQFQRSAALLVTYTSFLGDELIDGHTYRPHRPWDLRDLNSGDLTPTVYNSAHAARGAADTLAAKIAPLVENPSADLSMAWARVYSGYSLVFLGEYFCSSPINAGAALSPAELLGLAVERFEDAIAIAAAARAAGQDADAADRIIDLANVGAARASLQAGEDAAALSFAGAVPADFVFWVDYSTNSGESNYLYNTVTTYNPESTGVRWAGIDPAFEDLVDLRVVHTDERMPIMDTRLFYAPYQSSSYSGWVPGEQVAFAQDMKLRLASGLEARYIEQEVNGADLAFINERRAVGGQAALTQAELDAIGAAAELREQRRRDFFMDGHRLGDLRRYLARDGVDFFPAGAYPQFEDDYAYSTATCIPLSQNELDGNPNV